MARGTGGREVVKQLRAPCGSVRRELRLQNLGLHRDAEALLLPSCVLSPSHEIRKRWQILHGWNHQNYHQKPCHQGQRSRRLLSDQKDPKSKRLPLLSWLLPQSQQPSPQLCCVSPLQVHSPQHCRNKLRFCCIICWFCCSDCCSKPTTTGLRGCREGRCLDTKGFELAAALLAAGAVPVSGPGPNKSNSSSGGSGQAHSGRPWLSRNALALRYHVKTRTGGHLWRTRFRRVFRLRNSNLSK